MTTSDRWNDGWGGGDEPSRGPGDVFRLLRLDGKTALVTGGAGWLGASISAALAEAGARVLITSRDAQKAEGAALQLVSRSAAPHGGLALDLTDEQSIERAWEAASQGAGVDILVNNAIAACGADWSQITMRQFHEHQANSAGVFLLCRRFREGVVRRQPHARQGAIINIASMYAQTASYPDAYEGVCPANSVAYQTLKAGVVQLTRHLAVYWAADNIRVNCISPGPFPNPAAAPQELMRRLCDKSPMRRMGAPDELKGAVVLLASAAGAYITGHNLVVDGGWTAW